MATPRLLIFGFSNVATTSGFCLPTIERLDAAFPGIEVLRVGLGALQPQVAPAYLRMAHDRLGPFTHVLLEINSSAYATHPLSTEAGGRELLADTLLAVREMGADPVFMLHYRRWKVPLALDFNALVRRFCAEADLPLIDLAEGLVDRYGIDAVQGWLRDDTHTTPEGGVVMAEELAPVLRGELARDPWFGDRVLPRPQLRRGSVDLGPLLPDLAVESFECVDLMLPYLRLDKDADVNIDLGETIFAQGLVHLFHPAGGRSLVTVDDAEKPLVLTTIDPFSYYVRIGVLAFDFYRGGDVRRLRISPVDAADDVQLLKGDRETPTRAYVGPLLTLERL
ncbi:hypothetical protein LA6_004563 [Marinibacterium anthonyi]|nr:hypothetical protein LA6_004563 [Marinibacterium anthonyi]